MGQYFNVDMVVCLGDFFDRPELNAEEISSLHEIVWNQSVPHYFLVGNHEMGINDLNYSSSHLFALIPNCIVIKNNHSETINRIKFRFIPYTLNPTKEDLVEDNTIIFSHNDIAGIQMGKFVSAHGFNIEDIKNSCKLFINGHLHNGTKICDGVINIGNLTGLNFGEDALNYEHNIFILDTDTLQIEAYENPYAFNFYKLDLTKKKSELNFFKPNSVVMIKCWEKDSDYYNEYLSNIPNIIKYRVLIEYARQEETDTEEQLLTIDHLKKFKEYVLENIGSDDIVKEELAEVTK